MIQAGAVDILMDGHDLREYTLASLRNQVALVSQNVHLFNDTVANNIAYARTEQYSREQIEEAARMAYAMDFINKMDNGLDTVIGENGVLLSGGQRQALTLLMASLKQPKLLLLDEHTAALDPKTADKVLALSDQIVQENNLTTLMITHNMKDAIAHGNRLIMMDAGRVVVDISGEDKKKLTVPDLLALFSRASGSDEANDKMLLS